MNENSAASYLLTLLRAATLIVEPDLLIPGKMANICTMPISSERHSLIGWLVTNALLPTNKTKPLTKRQNATSMMRPSNKLLTSSSKNNPTIAAGTMEITTNIASLRMKHHASSSRVWCSLFFPEYIANTECRGNVKQHSKFKTVHAAGFISQNIFGNFKVAVTTD